MFSGLTYRKKNQWLIIGSLSFLLLCYFLSLRITKESISHNFELQGSVEVSRNAPQLIREYEEELAKTEQIFGNNSNDEFIFQDQLLAVVTPFCEQNHLVLRSFPAPHKMESGDLKCKQQFLPWKVLLVTCCVWYMNWSKKIKWEE